MAEKKRGRGRPPHEPNDNNRGLVEGMAACGIPHEDIAKRLRIARATLEKHYRYELDTGHIAANAKVGGTLFEMATKDKVPSAAIWWSKARMGWRENINLDVDANVHFIQQHKPRNGRP